MASSAGASDQAHGHVAEPKNFAPKTVVQLNPPKDNRISSTELAKCNGKSESPYKLLSDTLRESGTLPS